MVADILQHGRESAANGEHFDHPIEIISGTVINEHNQVRHLVHQSFMPEYPMTAEDGVCYVIYVGHMSAPEVENLHKQVSGTGSCWLFMTVTNSWCSRSSMGRETLRKATIELLSPHSSMALYAK